MHEAKVSEPPAYGFANSINYTIYQKPDSETSQAFLFSDDMDQWDAIFEQQHSVCLANGLKYIQIDIELRIGVADNVFDNLIPINGLRHAEENGSSGWYIWAGEEFSEDAEFFKTYCIKHLLKLKPEVLKYLALPAGYRFLIDNNDYEDIWYDGSLLIH